MRSRGEEEEERRRGGEEVRSRGEEDWRRGECQRDACQMVSHLKRERLGEGRLPPCGCGRSSSC